MRWSFVVAVLSIFIGGVLFVSAYDKFRSADAIAPAAEPKPDPQIEHLLKALGGTWSITDELAPDSKSPQGQTGVGTIVWRPGPGSFSAVEEFRSKQGNQDVTGLGVLWWDNAANGYHTIWCDSTNPGGCIKFENPARWEGSSLVLQENYVLHGKSYTFKEIFGDITADSFTQTLFGGEVGNALKVDEVIRAKRAAASTSPK